MGQQQHRVAEAAPMSIASAERNFGLSGRRVLAVEGKVFERHSLVSPLLILSLTAAPICVPALLLLRLREGDRRRAGCIKGEGDDHHAPHGNSAPCGPFTAPPAPARPYLIELASG